MTSQLLQERCRQAVSELADEQGWHLSAEGRKALALAILPMVAAAGEQGVHSIRRIALNYYLDGPMVQQMRTPGSPDGERLWAEWRAYMITLARGRGLSPESAEELAQDVYFQTVKALPNFQFGSRLKTYFCGIFVNCYRHWVRAARQVEQRTQALPAGSGCDEEGGAYDLIDERPSPEAQVIEQAQHLQIGKLVALEVGKIINSADFQILHLYYVEQTFADSNGKERKWTDKEIGEQLGMPLNTITSRRLRAIQRLQQNAQLRNLFAQLTDEV